MPDATCRTGAHPRPASTRLNTPPFNPPLQSGYEPLPASDLRLLVLPRLPACNWAGRAYVGGGAAWLVTGPEGLGNETMLAKVRAQGRHGWVGGWVGGDCSMLNALSHLKGWPITPRPRHN